jgi:hypothetical protein
MTYVVLIERYTELETFSISMERILQTEQYIMIGIYHYISFFYYIIMRHEVGFFVFFSVF